MNYSRDLAAPLDQGDIFRRVPTIIAVSELLSSTLFEPANVIVVSHGCEIDKASASTVLVACVIKLDRLPNGLDGMVRKGRKSEAFYLPKEDPHLLVDTFIDWRTIQPVPKSELLGLRQSEERFIGTVVGDKALAMRGSLLTFLVRLEATEMPTR